MNISILAGTKSLTRHLRANYVCPQYVIVSVLLVYSDEGNTWKIKHGR